MKIKKYENGFLDIPVMQKQFFLGQDRYNFFDINFFSNHIVNIHYEQPTKIEDKIKQKFSVEFGGLENNPTFIKDFFSDMVGQAVEQDSFFQHLPEKNQEDSFLYADIHKTYNFFDKETEAVGANEYRIPGIFDLENFSYNYADKKKNFKKLNQLSKLQPIDLKHLIFSPKSSELLKQKQNTKWIFPLFTDFEFNTEVPLELAQFLVQANLMTDVMKFGLFSELNSQFGMRFENSEPLKFLNLNLVLEKFFQNQSFDFSSIPNFEKSFKVIGEESQSSSLKQLFTMVLLRAKIKDLLMKNNRTIQQIHKGREPYSETLFYEVAKYEASEQVQGVTTQQLNLFQNEIPVQVTMFPNTEGFGCISMPTIHNRCDVNIDDVTIC